MTPYEQSLALYAEKLANIQSGFCRCGCGRRTKIAKFTNTKRGLRKGCPLNYIVGHNPRRALKAHADQLVCICRNESCNVPYGCCHCGCGQKTVISKQGHTRLGHIKGMPRKFIVGHSGACRKDFRPIRFGELEGSSVAFVPLTRGFVAVVDREDAEKLPGMWCHSHGYATQWSNDAGKCIRMHRVIMDAPDHLVVDHINSNPLDNRKCNLRLATVAQNVHNNGVRSDNTSGVTGVRFRPERNRFEFRISFQGKTFTKHFDEFPEAVKARKIAEEELFGEFRRKG